jgi:deoxyribodipyrimidine photolyase-related protein
MGTFAAGPLMTTKPYVSGAAYVHRMSDYCRGCGFDPHSTCPMTRLYWSFLRRHADTLGDVARAGPVLATARRRSAADVARDEHVRARVLAALGAGQRLTPADLAES